MSVYSGIYIYIVPSTGQLALYSTVYCRIVYYEGWVMTMMEAIKETIWLQVLLDDLGIDQDLLNINYDSMNAIYLAKNQVCHATMKHIDVRFHFIWEILDRGDIELQKIYTKENPADMLTNVVLRVKFAHYKELLYIISVA